MATLLEQLKKMTVVVADTGDIAAARKFGPRDATTNPSLIAAATKIPELAGIIDHALAKARADKVEGRDAQIKNAIDRLCVEFGMEILKIVPGRVSTEVDARLSFDTAASIAKARKLIGWYEAAGISRARVLIKVASTWEGFKAAEQLELEGIHCNLTLLFGMHQAIAGAEAKVTLISPFVGRILDWYLKDSGKKSYAPAEDPGVISVTRIFNYYKKFGYPTEVMGASFRNVGENTELAGCDLLTISPKLLGELEVEGSLPRKLDAAAAKAMQLERIPMDEATFRKMHDADRMAKEKLAEGIEGFTKAIVELEELIGKKLDAAK